MREIKFRLGTHNGENASKSIVGVGRKHGNQLGIC